MPNNKKLMLGSFIFQRRKMLGLTQQQLADKLDISNKAVSKWETLEANPDISIIVKLAQILQVTTDELLSGTINQACLEKEKKSNDLDVYFKNIKTQEKLKDKIKFAVKTFLLIIFSLAALFLSISTILAFNPKSFESSSEQANVIIVSTIFMFIFGTVAILLYLSIYRYYQKHRKIPSNIVTIEGYTVYYNLTKKERRDLNKRYMHHDKKLYLVFAAAILVWILLLSINIYLKILWLSSVLLITGYLLYIGIVLVLSIRRQKWFVKNKIIFKMAQLRNILQNKE